MPITAFQSYISIEACHLSDNHADNGVAIWATENKVSIFGRAVIINNCNRSGDTGGGTIYLYQRKIILNVF